MLSFSTWCLDSTYYLCFTQANELLKSLWQRTSSTINRKFQTFPLPSVSSRMSKVTPSSPKMSSPSTQTAAEPSSNSSFFSSVVEVLSDAFSYSQIQGSPLSSYPSTLLNNIDPPLNTRAGSQAPSPKSRSKPRKTTSEKA